MEFFVCDNTVITKANQRQSKLTNTTIIVPTKNYNCMGGVRLCMTKKLERVRLCMTKN